MSDNLITAIIAAAPPTIALIINLMITRATLKSNERTMLAQADQSAKVKRSEFEFEHREKVWELASGLYAQISKAAMTSHLKNIHTTLDMVEPYVMNLCIVCNSSSDVIDICKEILDFRHKIRNERDNYDMLAQLVLRLGSALSAEFSKSISPSQTEKP